MEDIFKSHLYLGSASYVLLRCGNGFSARGLAELRRKTAKLPWAEDIFGGQHNNVRLQARVSTSKSKLYHTGAVESRVIAGVYEALGHDDVLPNTDLTSAIQYPSSTSSENDPVVRLEVQVTSDQVDIWLCTSTTPLHRRGYRLETSKAPLREDLAYAMLYAAGWYPRTREQTECHYKLLLDPMCGSGTIAIEGAAMLAGLAPGRLRPPPLLGTRFQNNPLHNDLLLLATTQTTKNMVSTTETVPMVFASDRDAGAVAATKSNAERAGVLHYMDIQQCAISSHPLWSNGPDADHAEQERLLVATNPPFGKRVSKAKISTTTKVAKDVQLLPLYQSLSQCVLGRRSTDAVLLAHRTDLIQRSGLKMEALFRSIHGGLSVSVSRTKENTGSFLKGGESSS